MCRVYFLLRPASRPLSSRLLSFIQSFLSPLPLPPPFLSPLPIHFPFSLLYPFSTISTSLTTPTPLPRLPPSPPCSLPQSPILYLSPKGRALLEKERWAASARSFRDLRLFYQLQHDVEQLKSNKGMYVRACVNTIAQSVALTMSRILRF